MSLVKAIFVVCVFSSWASLVGALAPTASPTTNKEACCTLGLLCSTVTVGTCLGVGYGAGSTCPGTGGCPALPTAAPTSVPSLAPTAGPTPKPTALPTAKPTAVPTLAPTNNVSPTASPTASYEACCAVDGLLCTVTLFGTCPGIGYGINSTCPLTGLCPGVPTAVPTAKPSAVPTAAPTAVATLAPSVHSAPTASPTQNNEPSCIAGQLCGM
jgi:hypothetical protein